MALALGLGAKSFRVRDLVPLLGLVMVEKEVIIKCGQEDRKPAMKKPYIVAVLRAFISEETFMPCAFSSHYLRYSAK